MHVLEPRLVKKCVGAVKIVDISQYRQRTKYSLSFAISEVWNKISRFQDLFNIYKCSERPPAQNTRHTIIGNVINM